MATPFEKVLEVCKRASMLIEAARHDWKYAEEDTRYHSQVFAKHYTYVGWFQCVSKEAAQELHALFQECEDLDSLCAFERVSVLCYLGLKERRHLEEIKSQQDDTF